MRNAIEERAVKAIAEFVATHRPRLTKREQHSLKLYVKRRIEDLAMANGWGEQKILDMPSAKINVPSMAPMAINDARPHYESISYHC